MRKRILLLGATTGYQTRAFSESAAKLDFDLVMATDRCHVLDDPWGDQAIAIRFEKPEQSAKILAREAAGVNGIIAVGDKPTYLAALAARELEIPYNTPESVEACRNKFLARQRFEAAGLPVPTFARFPLNSDPETLALRVEYPCVLKPLCLSASRGVIRADNATEFVAAFQRICALLNRREIVRLHEDADNFLQVERYIAGREFAVEGIVSHGQVQIHAIFDKPDPLEGPFFEETIYVTPSREDDRVQQALARATAQAVEALGLSHGPIHAEMRYNDAGVWMLEVAARPIGGLCSRALAFEGGVTLEELILRHAAGEDVTSIRREDQASGVMMIPIPRAGIYRGVSGVENAAATPGTTEVLITAKEGQRLEPLPEGASYLGFVFVTADSPTEAEASLREAHQRLGFDIALELPVSPSTSAGYSREAEQRPLQRSTPPSA